jgi:hypothetical protein
MLKISEFETNRLNDINVGMVIENIESKGVEAENKIH